MDIDTTLPTPHRENRSTMQLESLPQDEVMMEVEPDLSPATSAKIPSSPKPRPTATQFLAISANSSPPRTLEPNVHVSRQFPLPPVVSITSSDISPWPKLKLDQLFVEWLALPDSTTWITRVLENAKEGRRIDIIPSLNITRYCKPERSLSPTPSRSPTLSQPSRSISPQQTPSSPVSRLFNMHIPFGESDSFPKSPPSTTLSSAAHFRAGGIAQITTDVDLGKSGTKSPDSRREHASFSTRINGMISKAKQDRDAQVETEVKISAAEKEDSSSPIQNQISEKSTLDKVADGIAGMSAVMDQVNVQMTTSDVKVGDMINETRKDVESPARRYRFSGDSSQDHAKEEERAHTEETEMSVEVDTLSYPSKGRDLIQAATDGPISEDSLEEKTINSIPIRVSSAKPSLPPRSSTKQSKSVASSINKSRSLPRFYFPCGHDAETREKREVKRLREFFDVQRRQKHISGVTRADIAELVVDVIGLPSYFANIIYEAILELFPLDGKEVKKEAAGNTEDRKQSVNSKSEEQEMKDVSANSEVAKIDTTCSDRVQRKDTAESDTTMGDIEENKQGASQPNGIHTEDQADGFPNSGTQGTNISMEDQNATSNLTAGRDYITEAQFTAYYNAKCFGSSKEQRLFSALLEPGALRNYLIPSDFKPLLRALLNCHQGLAFLHATPEFQQRYSETVIERIYFGCTRHHNGRLTLHDIRRSKLLDTLMVVDEEEDINKERKYFSYEHFYVLYCRFWELDANHDLQIDRDDLMRYGSHSLTYRIVDRIFGGSARPLDTPETPGFMSYTDFIWFCLSEEDKTSDTAIDYWFRCVDMDGDGIITMYDMEFFYREQLHRMQCFGHEPVKVKDILCQLLDMINPHVRPPVVRRRDLKRCRLAGNFFNVLFNLNKFFAIEARDPIQIRQEHATPELTDWDRFAALEYLRLSAEDDVEEDESWEDVGEAGNPLIAGEAPF